MVTSPGTDQLLGKFVNAGEDLIHVSDPREKEVLAIVSESDMTAFQNAALQRATASVRLRGGKTIEAKLEPLRPAARKTLPHAALSASVGGPLAVEPARDSTEMRLVQPQLDSVVALDTITSARVHAGQVGRLTIPDDRSFASRLWDRLTEETSRQ